jgi:UDP-N-acetylmuramoyl-tripeptide--D-alanyl-D-alanine ligase
VTWLNQQLHQQFSQSNTPQVTVLAKGARSSRMEDVIIALQEDK